jgi:uncharacterized protein (DUF2147 family)
MKPDAERESKIQVFKCGAGKKNLCAKIAWLKNPLDSKGKPLHDIRNQNTALRGRPIVGLQIFTNLAPSAPSTWSGQIYNPEDGNTYTATLTVLSRKEIKLRGCKAWLLCGEKQWLRTSAPPADVIEPAKPTEGGEQIEASATPSAPTDAKPKPDIVLAAEPEVAKPVEVAVTPSAEPAVPALPSDGPAPQEATQAAAIESVPAPAAAATPVAYVAEVATPSPASDAYNWRQGYRFIQVSTSTDTAAGLSGENVSSMFTMAKPIASDAATPAGAEQGEATAAIEPVPAPEQKPKVKPKPVVAAAASAPKPAKSPTPPKPAVEGTPAPQEAEATSPEDGEVNALAAETAEAAMAEDAVPLSRREKRRLRRQHGQEPFLPWLR